MTELPITLHLNRGGTSAVLHVPADGVPHLAHWGESLGELSEEQLDALDNNQYLFEKIPKNKRKLRIWLKILFSYINIYYLLFNLILFKIVCIISFFLFSTN